MKKIALIIAVFAFSFSANAQTKRNLKQEEANKKLVMTFYQKLIGDKDVSAIDQYLSPNYITHNPQMQNGREALKNAFNKDFGNAPKIKVDFRNVAADGNFVFLHMKMQNPAGKYEAVADIFKVENNKIVEMWDVIQEIPEKAANLHPMFSGTERPEKTKRNLKQEEANKKLVMTFYQQLFGDKDFTAIDTYLSQDYIQHNPGVADGSAALKTATKIWFEGAPKEKIIAEHLAAEGDLVFIHKKEVGADGKISAIMDIFRVKNKKIIEHWDVIQEAPEHSVNPKPMF